MRIHSLTSGATVLSLSPHGFKFSDGTESPPQDSDHVKAFEPHDGNDEVKMCQETFDKAMMLKDKLVTLEKIF